MKAITLTQPWATLVAIGAKKIETRSWATPYRGPLAIHAAKGYTRDMVRLALMVEPFKTTLRDADYPLFSLLPRGMIVATCQLVDCIQTEKCTELSFLESAFGDYSPHRWAWILEDVKPLPEPIPAKGALSLWEWNDRGASIQP